MLHQYQWQFSCHQIWCKITLIFYNVALYAKYYRKITSHFSFISAEKALSTAERQKRFREKIRADPQKREEYLKKERERYDRRKISGEIPSIRDLSDSEKIYQREKWRERKRKGRIMKKIQAQSSDNV